MIIHERSALKQLNNLGVTVFHLLADMLVYHDKKYRNKFENLTFLIDRVCNSIDKPIFRY